MSHLDSGTDRRPTTAASDPNTAVPSRAPSETIELSEVEKKHNGERDGVNVKDAEAEFNALSRRLTRQSTKHNELTGSGDVEKQETFDLLDYLRSTSGKRDEAGFAHKHVGVTFENLRVTGVGGVKICKRFTFDRGVPPNTSSLRRRAHIPRRCQRVLVVPVLYWQKPVRQASGCTKDHLAFLQWGRPPRRDGSCTWASWCGMFVLLEDDCKSTGKLLERGGRCAICWYSS